jgi:hypothetical protein
MRGGRLRYDRAADILHIDKCPPSAELESEEPGDDVIARMNPESCGYRESRNSVLLDSPTPE